MIDSGSFICIYLAGVAAGAAITLIFGCLLLAEGKKVGGLHFWKFRKIGGSVYIKKET